MRAFPAAPQAKMKTSERGRLQFPSHEDGVSGRGFTNFLIAARWQTQDVSTQPPREKRRLNAFRSEGMRVQGGSP